MKSSWIIGIDKERITQVREDFLSSRGCRDRLQELLEAKIKGNTVVSRSKDNYALAGWPYMQADAVGYERALKEIISLITEEIVE
jgi:hypothetical protein